MVDLPQPLSPTRPMASPGYSLRSRIATALISPARVKSEMRRLSSASTGSRGAGAGRVRSVTQRYLPQAVGQQVEAEDQRRDGDAGQHRHVGEGKRHRTGLVDHAASVRVGRRQAKAEKAEHADGAGHIAHAQAGDRKSVV